MAHYRHTAADSSRSSTSTNMEPWIWIDSSGEGHTFNEALLPRWRRRRQPQHHSSTSWKRKTDKKLFVSFISCTSCLIMITLTSFGLEGPWSSLLPVSQVVEGPPPSVVVLTSWEQYSAFTEQHPILFCLKFFSDTTKLRPGDSQKQHIMPRVWQTWIQFTQRWQHRNRIPLIAFDCAAAGANAKYFCFDYIYPTMGEIRNGRTSPRHAMGLGT